MAIYRGTELEKDLSLECDVCIVGSGAGGAHVAARLAAAGKRVIVLEEGGYYTSDDFNMDEAEMFHHLYQEHANRATADLSISILQGRSVGGTTTVNWTTSFRTPKPVMDYWAGRFGVENLTYDALVPHWERVEERLNIREVPLDFMNRNNRVLWDGATKLGWEPHLLKRNVRDCASLGYCGMGCPLDAKQSMLVTMIPEAVDHGADVYANVRVQTIESEGSRISKVNGVAMHPDGNRTTSRTITVRSKVTVLSGGAINNPALLLRSKLGNRNGRVGKRTFLHPVIASAAIFDDPIEPFYGAPQSVASHYFQDRGPDKMGFFIEAAPIFPVFGGSASPGIGKDLQEIMDALYRMNATVAIGIDGFDDKDLDEGATVTLKDGGHPKIDYKWTPRLSEMLREGNKRVVEIQLAAGAAYTQSFHTRGVKIRSTSELSKLDSAPYEPNRVKCFTAHQMGGCIMGKDPKVSVVDSRLKHHEFDNLFIIDGSVFPTSLGVNPQLSIYGLSSWASQHVIAAV
ncbi:MAG: GMC family oxidoreductase [Deltaproteobacteria bacterium]|nr:GMC family oxidoreductase [Deltaproteobacteria bacterium]